MVQGNSANSKHEFKLGKFEGPLYLLLFLIKKSEVNIYDIPIAAITEQYLDYLNYVTRVDLDNITEFYVLAATLLYIKSRMLLPVELYLDDEFDDPRTALVEKLIEYQKYRKLSELMADQEKGGEWPITREKKQNILPFVDDEIWQQVNVWDLLQSFSSLISTIASERIIDLYEEVTINEKITLINEFLESGNEFYFRDLIIKRDSIMEIICSFLATLELIKAKRIIVLQNKLFGDIRIKSREKV